MCTSSTRTLQYFFIPSSLLKTAATVSLHSSKDPIYLNEKITSQLSSHTFYREGTNPLTTCNYNTLGDILIIRHLSPTYVIT